MKSDRLLRANRGGFSLLELLAVVTILGILAVIVIPRVTFSTATARESACYQNKAEVNSAVERYLIVNDGLPADISALDADDYFPEGLPTCPVSGAAYALDPASKRVVGHSGGGKGGGH
jgi:general secretion pathway protein G